MKESVELKGLSFRTALKDDDSGIIPWEEFCGHGPVRHVRAYRRDAVEKNAGERILSCSNAGGTYLYDWAAALALAEKDGWGLSPADAATLAKVLGREPTAAEIRTAAVGRDFELLRGFVTGDWSYVGVVVTLLDIEGAPTDETASLWGIESNAGDYLDVVAKDLAAEIDARISRKKLLTVRVRK